MDHDGFDAAADTVGAGIYSGSVKRDAECKVMIGKQYKNHNPYPGPVYDGKGYTVMAKAIHQGPEAVLELLARATTAQERRNVANEIMTGGATPLHTCGMSQRGQLSTQVLIDAGGEIEADDTYGYTPLHRMASNNLEIGAEALLKAGANVNRRSGPPYDGQTALAIATSSRAQRVANVLLRYGGKM